MPIWRFIGTNTNSKQKKVSRAIFLNNLLNKKITQNSPNFLFGAAYATAVGDIALSKSIERSMLSGLVRTAQIVYTRCQAFKDDRYLVQIIEDGGYCYEELVDTYTGNIVSSVQVQCEAACELLND